MSAESMCEYTLQPCVNCANTHKIIDVPAADIIKIKL